MRKRLAALLVLASVSAACSSGPSEPTPAALRAYITALQEQRYDEAYAMTQLDEIADAFGPGAAVTGAHFIASWEANPLEDYEITEIIRLRRRDIDDFGEGDAYFETMVRFSTAATSWTANIGVEGEIAGTVVADAYPIRFEAVPRGARVAVDGVALDVGPDPSGAMHLLVLEGRHDVMIGDRLVRLDAEPLTLIEGDATADADGPGTIRLR